MTVKDPLGSDITGEDIANALIKDFDQGKISLLDEDTIMLHVGDDMEPLEVPIHEYVETFERFSKIDPAAIQEAKQRFYGHATQTSEPYPEPSEHQHSLAQRT